MLLTIAIVPTVAVTDPKNTRKSGAPSRSFVLAILRPTRVPILSGVAAAGAAGSWTNAGLTGAANAGVTVIMVATAIAAIVL